MKSKAIEMLGEDGLQLPALIAAALDANDRVKYLFSLLQSAVSPDMGQPVAGQPGVAPEGGARRDGPLFAIPDFDQIRQDILATLTIMQGPFAVAAARDDSFARRFQPLRADFLALPGDALPRAAIDRITSADRKQGDSLHLLVMDLHKALNRLQVSLAENSIDGAAVYALGEGDDDLVRAFMAGLNRTAKLKFDHPGLGTTATRSGDRLVIQNDIGTTDAHVIVVHVESDVIRVTYSDVHLARLQFFRSLFPAAAAQWSDPDMREEKGLARNQPFYLTVASFPAADAGIRRRHLELIGSRLVFLIDWNKARKRLHLFLANDDAVALLKWGADENLGHRGFLQLGGETLIFEAVESVAAGQIRYGETLSDMVGPEAAAGFLKFVLRACSEGLSAGRSDQLVRDQIRAELYGLFRSREQQLVALAADHAAYVLEIADNVRGALVDLGGGGKIARQAKIWERCADEKLMALRARAHGKAEALLLCRIVECADDAADHLEEAAWQIGLYPERGCEAAILDPLQTLAGLLVEDARDWIKALANAEQLLQHSDRRIADDYLVATDALARLERETDRAERDVMAALVAHPPGTPAFYLIAAIAGNLEDAGDSLMRAGMMLHDHMLGKIGRNEQWTLS